MYVQKYFGLDNAQSQKLQISWQILTKSFNKTKFKFVTIDIKFGMTLFETYITHLNHFVNSAMKTTKDIYIYLQRDTLLGTSQ